MWPCSPEYEEVTGNYCGNSCGYGYTCNDECLTCRSCQAHVCHDPNKGEVSVQASERPAMWIRC